MLMRWNGRMLTVWVTERCNLHCRYCFNLTQINRQDMQSNIVKQARYAVVGDWKKVLPAFTNKVKELLAG